MNTKSWAFVILSIAICCLAGNAYAAAYKCTNSTGGITFSDVPCPADATKGEKVMDRGAGSNHLNEQEKSAFTAAMMSRCGAARMVCLCVAETMADSLTYEEVVQTKRDARFLTPAIESKAQRALEQCRNVKPH